MRVVQVTRYIIDGCEFTSVGAAEKHIEGRLGAHIDKALVGVGDALRTVAQSGCITGPVSELVKTKLEVFEYLRAHAADIAALLTADMNPVEFDD